MANWTGVRLEVQWRPMDLTSCDEAMRMILDLMTKGFRLENLAVYGDSHYGAMGYILVHSKE